MRLVLALILFPLAATAQDRPVLDVLTYDSFTTEWGPGPQLKTLFEAECGCTLRFTAPGDAAAVLSRLKLEGARSTADVVLGLDTNLMADAKDSGLFVPLATIPDTDLPVDWTDDTFAPFDWGWFAFIHTTDITPPTSFEDLAASDLQVVIQDPRSSTPGLGLAMWIKAEYGPRAPEIWAALADNILTVTPGWSEAYGLFTEGEADMVLSYTTSPAYHILAEGDDTKAAAIFPAGHYLQVELAGKLAATDQPDLADRFLTFLLTPAAQEVIATTNWMYPARAVPLPEGFDRLPRPEKTIFLSPDDVRAQRDAAIAEWQAALSR
ncbi:thiamine ABC transporter substrate binding subunit [Falsirhodobacter halotolerans]|uniref:thiamine ABC transporter substrate binding subunit n=1 Tax=Falsirhodobacter halotolerans TaxID=1146892 RepID=UPI001FD0270B|nr:thiamine ABC transporter substrate binding subunit [Falsirhodobacter halotolerans]MCJ8138263.1 thiamine ABC transporter substrate binding subunit [Falsirhodobacter halotolerans]